MVRELDVCEVCSGEEPCTCHHNDTAYKCDECGDTYFDKDEAEKCEISHNAPKEKQDEK